VLPQFTTNVFSNIYKQNHKITGTDTVHIIYLIIQPTPISIIVYPLIYFFRL